MKIVVNIPVEIEFSEAHLAPHYYDLAEHWVEEIAALMQPRLGQHVGMTMGKIQAQRIIEPPKAA